MNPAFINSIPAIRQDIESLHKAFQQDEVTRQIVILRMAKILAELGLKAVPSWKPPRSTRDRVDLVGVVPKTDPPEVKIAFAVDPLVELPKIKAMDWVSCDEKIVVTFSLRGDKVSQSRFFLAPGMEHINIFE